MKAETCIRRSKLSDDNSFTLASRDEAEHFQVIEANGVASMDSYNARYEAEAALPVNCPEPDRLRGAQWTVCTLFGVGAAFRSAAIDLVRVFLT